jgi:hypothetical protein
MITTNLTGNFGNHMWYYCVCRIVAEKKGFEWGINPIATHDYYGGQSQFYFMDVDYGKEVTLNGKNKNGLNKYLGIDNEYNDDVNQHIYQGDSCLINMYDPKVFDVEDNTMVHIISQSEDYLIDRKSDILDWFKIKPEYEDLYEQRLSELGIKLDDNTCVINFRGGEYRSVPNLILRREYWRDCINHMLSINPNMKFIIITDDPGCAISYVGEYPCYHIEIGFDFYVVNKSKYVILSNSSFGWWAGWLNQNANLILAPKYWAKHNVSNGYWSLGDSYTRCFTYMDRDGNIVDYETCKKEALEFYKNNNLI